MVAERGVRPTALQPLWNVAGFALGAATALMGPRAAMAATAAIEDVIEKHYAQQLEELGDKDPELSAVVKQFRDAIRSADAVLYVVQWAATSLSEVRRSMTALRSAVPEGLTVIPVLNQKDMSMSTYHNKYADYYHEAEA